MKLSKLIHGFSKLLDGFVRINTRISPSWYMDLSKLVLGFVKVLQGFVKVVLCFSRSLPNKTKLKFDQDFKACWSFYFELLKKSKYSMPWVRCTFGKVFSIFSCYCFQRRCLQSIYWETWPLAVLYMERLCRRGSQPVQTLFTRLPT